MFKPFKKAWIAFAGTAGLAAVQTALTEVDMTDSQRSWLLVVQAVLVTITTAGVFGVKNEPKDSAVR